MRNYIIRLVLQIVAIIAINLIASVWYYRLDLTADKRYTLSDNTKSYLNSLSKPLDVTVYLDGDLNPGFKKLSKNVIEMLEEMSYLGNNKLHFILVDPNEGSSLHKKDLQSRLLSLGCTPVPVFEATEDGRNVRTMVFPYAVISAGDKTLTVNLLENIQGFSGAENLNKSAEVLEYKLMEAIRKLSMTNKTAIAFLEGHNELDDLDVLDVTKALSEFYDVDRGVIGTDVSVLNRYKVLIIAKPQTKFTETEKFVLDQYVMQGGRLLWMVDGVNLTLDSLRNSSNTLGVLHDVGLSDILFKYGFRINPIVIEDIQATQIPVNSAPVGAAPKFIPVPWYFSPLLQPVDMHPVSKNINMVAGEFVSSIDTVGENMGLKRQVLLTTSRFSKVNAVPVFVTLAMVNEKPVREEYNKSFIPVAYLQEGSFPSVFKNRSVPEGVTGFAERLNSSKPTRMILVADGDIARNSVRQRHTSPQIIPLGYNELSGQTYGNRDFILNAVNYLADDDGWLTLRARNYTLRILDKEKLGNELMFWKIVNVALPVLLVICFGLLFIWLRRRKYRR